jgi:hypothetical protein
MIFGKNKSSRKSIQYYLSCIKKEGRTQQLIKD